MTGKNVVKLDVEFRRKKLVRGAEVWASPEPSDLMIWEVCPYTRGNGKMECAGCPPFEEIEGHGRVIRGCRMLAAEACRVIMAVQRREALTPAPAVSEE